MEIMSVSPCPTKGNYSATLIGALGLPLERQDERVEKIVGLFAAGRKVGADDGKGISADFEAEKTGDFLLEFGHSQVAFGLVVVEGNAPTGEEAQDLVAVLAQSPNEVAGRGLPKRRHFLRNPKWDPSDFGFRKKSGDGHGLRRPTFVLRSSRRALRSSLTLPRFPVLLLLTRPRVPERRAGSIAGFGFSEDGVVAGPQALDVAGGQCLEGLGLGLADPGIGLA